MANKHTITALLYFCTCLSILVGLVMQDFYKIPLTGGIIVLGLIWVFSFGYKEKYRTLITKPLALAFLGFYLLHLLSSFYSSNSSVALHDLQLKISLVLLPIFMLSTSLFSKDWKRLLLKAFSILMVGMAVYDLFTSYTEFIISSNYSSFYYKNLPHLLVSKPHYVAWYYSFALFIALYEIIIRNKYKILWSIAASILMLSLIFLSSRAYLLAFSIVAIISGTIWIRKRSVSKRSILKLLLPLGFLISLALIIPNTRARIVDTYAEINKLVDHDDHRQTNPRVYIWKYAGKLIKEKMLLGYGIGDAKLELNKALEKCDALFWNGSENVLLNKKQLNYHNQFLQTWAEVGILGLLLLLYLMIKPFFLKNKHPLFLIFVGLTLFGFLTESMLERQAGVVMLAFMYPLLYSLGEEKMEN